MKETLFGILSDRVLDARFLDLYAGSGSVGIEALSRGAGNVLGTRQSGLPPLKVASLFEPRHLVLAERARDLADGLIAADPMLTARPQLVRLRDEFTALEQEGDAA